MNSGDSFAESNVTRARTSRTRANRRRKTNFIQAVIDRHCDARANLDRLFQEVSQQRKSQKAVGNGAAERRFTLARVASSR